MIAGTSWFPAIKTITQIVQLKGIEKGVLLLCLPWTVAAYRWSLLQSLVPTALQVKIDITAHNTKR